MLTPETLTLGLRHLTAQAPMLGELVDNYGVPPLWQRPPGFASLLYIILEQQVSLASARATYQKLQAELGEVTPEVIQAMSTDALRACHFSRQKSAYAKHLATEILDHGLDLDALSTLGDEAVRARLTQVKGIGSWTANMYLLLCLRRPDIFPAGDLAVVKVLKELDLVAADADKEALLAAAEPFRPHRSALTFLLWHKYLEDRGLAL